MAKDEQKKRGETVDKKKEKLPKYKELAEHLGVTEQAVKQYHKEKRRLMLIGLKHDNGQGL